MSNVRIVTPIHTCGGVPGCTACFADLHAKIAAAETRERAWSLALQSLTPGGSEYADDPEACVKFVRETRAAQPQQILTLVATAKQRSEEAERACERADQDFRVMHDQLAEHVSEQAQILRLTARAAQHIGGSATLPLTVTNLHSQLAAANAEIELLRKGINAAIEARSAESCEQATCLCVPGSFDCSYHQMLFALEGSVSRSCK